MPSIFYKTKKIIEQCDTPAGRIFDLFILLLIILSFIAFSLETLPNLNPIFSYWLRLFEVFTVAIFTIEYFLRLYVSDKKFKFIFSPYGIIDLLAILPFYLALGVDLRSVRILRLFRLIRIFKLFRYSHALERLVDAFKEIKEELILFVVAISFVLIISSVGIYYFENPVQPEIFSSIFTSFWWSVVSITTVGYGDMAPITIGGRIFTFFLLILGIGIIAAPTGLLAASLSKTAKKDKDEAGYDDV